LDVTCSTRSSFAIANFGTAVPHRTVETGMVQANLTERVNPNAMAKWPKLWQWRPIEIRIDEYPYAVCHGSRRTCQSLPKKLNIGGIFHTLRTEKSDTDGGVTNERSLTCGVVERR